MTALVPGERAAAGTGRLRRRFVVRGVVQGVGFRPFVHALATELALIGSVRNDSGGVVAEVEGPAEAVAAFGRRLRAEPPPLALVERVTESALPPRGGTGFRIAVSTPSVAARTLASPDIATCDACLAELGDPADRRYRHPFLTCTHCGPRYTITLDLPYDRASTTMAGFPMCTDCAREYADPADRRFHAQPIACPRCGPRLEFLRPGAPPVAGTEPALVAARRLLAAGGVLAVKGLGGYHLACRAADPRAVGALRVRKRRGAKPFAVMVPDLAAAERIAELDGPARRLLTDRARPIVLVPRRAAPGEVVDDVAPGNPDLGVLLPYTPLHALLLGTGPDGPGPGVLVMTSGNLGGEPIAADDDDALTRLAGLADGWLRHDRPIAVPCDDSVLRVVGGEPLPVRRSRGYAPLPVPLPVPVPPTLAAGADLKNALALGRGSRAWLSGHIGDFDDLATWRSATAAEAQLEHLTGVRPGRVVADAHPGYRSRAWAGERAAGRPVGEVQHHHAHVAALMAEHGLDGGIPVVGVALDGTGYGTDGAVWGGEVLLTGRTGFERFAHLGYVPLAGGDASVQRPYRMALAHLRAAGVTWDDDLAPVAACPPAERAALDHQLRTGLGCVPTSSMGRLFDAVASLAGVRHRVDFEAQAAIELEALARGVPEGEGYRFDVSGGVPAVADPSPVIRAVVIDLRAGVPAAVIAARFHAAVAGLVLDLARRTRAERGLTAVGLTGGVFQNAVLLAGTARLLAEDGFAVLRHRLVPPNDGGLALGQLLVTAQQAVAPVPLPIPEKR